MMHRLSSILFLCLLSTLSLKAQEEKSTVQLTESQLVSIMEDMTAYINEVGEITSNITSTQADEFPTLERQLQAVNVRWQTYKQMEQEDIAASSVLMELMSQYEMLYLTASDSMTAQKGRLTAQADFNNAKSLIAQAKPKYEQLSSDAMKFSLIPQTATQLAAVKSEEALLFQQITAAYQKAVASVALVPTLKQQMKELSEKYIELQTQSQEIQAAAYKSWMERIKDKVLTLAGIAILLLFFNFFITKLKAMKTAHDMAKKYGDTLNKNDQYPTI